VSDVPAMRVMMFAALVSDVPAMRVMMSAVVVMVVTHSGLALLIEL